LSKEECHKEVVKEAFKLEMVQLHDKKEIEEKHTQILNEISELKRLSQHQVSLIDRLEAEMRDLKLSFAEQEAKFSNKFQSAEVGPVENGEAVFEEAVFEGEPVFEFGVEVAAAVSEEGGVERQCEQGQLSNMYTRMKADQRAREESFLCKSPWIVHYRKRRCQ